MWLCPEEGSRVLPHLLTVESAMRYFLAIKMWRELALAEAWNVLLWSGLPSELLPSPQEQHALVTGPRKMRETQSRITQHNFGPAASSRDAPSNPQNNEREGSACPEFTVVSQCNCGRSWLIQASAHSGTYSCFWCNNQLLFSTILLRALCLQPHCKAHNSKNLKFSYSLAYIHYHV